MEPELEQPTTVDSEDQAQPEIVDNDVSNSSADEPQAVESDEDDYEVGDEKYRIPKTLKAHLDELKAGNLRNEDYTQKTQSVAEQRRAFEAERQQFAQQQQLASQHIEKVAEIKAIDRQLEQYQKLDWNALVDADPVNAMKLDRQMRELQQQRGASVAAVEQAQARTSYESQQETARRIHEAKATLTKEIQGYGTPEVMKELGATAKAFGYRDEELANVNDPRAVKLLYEASQYRKLMAKAKTAEKPEVKPITRIAGAGATASKDPSAMSDAEFAKWRQRQIAQRR